MAGGGKDQLELSTSYKVFLLALLFVFVGSLIARVALSYAYGSSTPDQADSLDLLDWVVRISLGAAIGALTGKAL